MSERGALSRVRAELRDGMGFVKCQKCGCMAQTLEHLAATLPELPAQNARELARLVDHWREHMQPIQYACLGCEYCFPAVAMNLLRDAFPEAARAQALRCSFEVDAQTWPVVPGEYFAFCDGPNCPVAVSTLASVELAERLAAVRPQGLCIVGKTETENIGIDKLVKNTITNRTIRTLLLVGREPTGHQSGRTLVALWRSGVDAGMRVIDTLGKHPVLRNVTRVEVEAFRSQVAVIDLIGCEDLAQIHQTIQELARARPAECSTESRVVRVASAQVVQAEQPDRVDMDKAGYFVILPSPGKGAIIVEHYSYDNRLLRVIEGHDARSICWTLIKHGWVTQLSHAAYLGKELARAELSIQLGLKYVQDGASRADS